MSKWRGCLVCLFLVTLPVTALADDARASYPRAYVGAGGGLGLVTFGDASPEQVVQTSATLGFTAGLFAGWQATDVIAIQMAVNLSVKGTNASGGGAAGSYSRSYMEFPFLFKLLAPLPGPIAPYASVGPALGILLQADTDLADGRHIDLTDRTERIDIGIMVGAGASIHVGPSGAVYVDATYNHGLLNTNKVAVNEASEATNRAFYVTVGYQTDLSVVSGGQ